MKHGSIKEWYEKADKASVNHEQEWFKQCLRDKTKLCIWEHLRDISIKKLMNANTFSNSQCSQSNVLLIIMNLTTNKTSGWYYDISSNESRYKTRRSHHISIQSKNIRLLKGEIQFLIWVKQQYTILVVKSIAWEARALCPSLYITTYSQYAVSVRSELWSYETYDNDLTRHINDLTRHQHLKSIPTLCKSIARQSLDRVQKRTLLVMNLDRVHIKLSSLEA